MFFSLSDFCSPEVEPFVFLEQLTSRLVLKLHYSSVISSLSYYTINNEARC